MMATNLSVSLKALSLEELYGLKEKILDENYYWRSSHDGLYEMALHYAGFDEVTEEIGIREGMKNGSLD